MTYAFHRLEALISADPHAAWPELVQFISGDAPRLEAEALLEDLVAQHVAEFIEDIESEADSSQRFAEAVAYATVGDAKPGVALDRFHALQRRVRDRLGIDYWEGWEPMSHEGRR
jgi:hypothetical protein